jgi:hypothetical protein
MRLIGGRVFRVLLWKERVCGRSYLGRGCATRAFSAFAGLGEEVRCGGGCHWENGTGHCWTLSNDLFLSRIFYVRVDEKGF